MSAGYDQHGQDDFSFAVSEALILMYYNFAITLLFQQSNIGRAEYSFAVSEAAKPKAVSSWPVAALSLLSLLTLHTSHACVSSLLTTDF